MSVDFRSPTAKQHQFFYSGWTEAKALAALILFMAGSVWLAYDGIFVRADSVSPQYGHRTALKQSMVANGLEALVGLVLIAVFGWMLWRFCQDFIPRRTPAMSFGASGLWFKGIHKAEFVQWSDIRSMNLTWGHPHTRGKIMRRLCRPKPYLGVSFKRRVKTGMPLMRAIKETRVDLSMYRQPFSEILSVMRQYHPVDEGS